MGELDKQKRIGELKRLARVAYTGHQSRLDAYSCGANLAAVITPAMYGLARNYNLAMAELRQLDPACPQFTPLPEGN